ncbi:unnamed protein product [Haemonchus placei]|uniref:Metalloendopeptidase n=1 Tax=Haemonchus placei TaxID=6290 RepID=A0A3P7YFW9_HAEPC|nr:unnamed protein product [Haemonchus placei]
MHKNHKSSGNPVTSNEILQTEPVDIFDNNGKGDIVQLWNLRKNDTRAYNAIWWEDLKWNITDKYGNTVIPYTITGPYNGQIELVRVIFVETNVLEGQSEQELIANAMQRIMDNTCIRFRKRTYEEDYIDIVNERDQGCYTNVGRQVGRNVLQLESSNANTCMAPRTVLHELLHLCGLWHEHMRYDRDSYIEILYGNIQEEYHIQFGKVNPYYASTYHVPYDYKSVMHYNKKAFAKPSKISIRTKDPKYQVICLLFTLFLRIFT